MRKSSVAIVAITLACSSTALAQDEEDDGLPISSSQRPLTLPELTLRTDVTGADYHFSLGPFGSADIGLIAFGVGFGILDDLEIDATVVPLFVGDDISDNDVVFANPLLGATYRFVDEEIVDVGASLTFSIPVADDRFFGMSPGIPVRLFLGDIARLDTGVYFSVLVPVSDELNDGDTIGQWAGTSPAPVPLPSGEPGIPIRFTINAVEYFFLGMRSGFGIADFGEPADTFFIPLGWQVGGTVPLDDQPLMDIGWFFDFPILFRPAVEDRPFVEADKVVTEYWVMGGFMSFYFPLGD
jgi:hypothetical protein